MGRHKVRAASTAGARPCAAFRLHVTRSVPLCSPSRPRRTSAASRRVPCPAMAGAAAWSGGMERPARLGPAAVPQHPQGALGRHGGGLSDRAAAAQGYQGAARRCMQPGQGPGRAAAAGWTRIDFGRAARRPPGLGPRVRSRGLRRTQMPLLLLSPCAGEVQAQASGED